MHHTNFENTLKYSYSHGLEEIYKLEVIDPKTIKTISPSSSSPLVYHEEPFDSNADPQMQLDLGPEWCGELDSFVLTEPIHMLGLSPSVEKIAYAHHLLCLQDLLKLDLQRFALHKGIGQGHVEEIKLKLNEYMQGKPIGKCKKVDLSSLLKNALGGLDRKHVQLVLEPFRLGGMMPLTALERLEIKKMSLPEREAIRSGLQTQLAAGPVLEYVCEKLEQIISVFIKPWLRQRQGFGTTSELHERLERVSVQPESTKRMWECLSTLFFTGTTPFHGCLIEMGEGFFAADRHVQKDTQSVLERARTYFYHPEIIYPLTQLMGYLEREFALKWVAFPEGFIGAVLKKSPSFILFKQNGQIHIKQG
jgi:hypothetical protein